MQLGFQTDSIQRAKAALILYAIYRSRSKTSSLNGLDTWNRFTAYIRGACLKSENTAQFVDVFCKMAGVGSIRPKYMEMYGGMIELQDGTLLQSSGVKEYNPDLVEDDGLLPIIEREGQLLVMLVRERIQREKMEEAEDDEEI